MPWNYKKWATARDPVHKSDLNNITGDYGCDKQFRYAKDEDADDLGDPNRAAFGRSACGSAAHETMARALSNIEIAARLTSGKWEVSRAQIDQVFREELDKEIGKREVVWDGDKPDAVIADRVSMIVGCLNDLHRYAAEVLLVEPAFIVRHDDGFWLSGHTDLIYRPRAHPIGIGLCDWKTGKQKPHAIELEHGWEAGIYSLGVRSGHFLRRQDVQTSRDDEGRWHSIVLDGENALAGATHASRFKAERRAIESALINYAVAHEEQGGPFDVTLGAFPDEIWHVHMGDYVPYQKAGAKTIARPEDCRYFNVEKDTKRNYVKGERRGGAWCEVKRTEYDIPRLGHQLRQVIGTVRMGRFAERIGEKCERCAFRSQCLTSGYEPRADEAREIERRLRVLGPAPMSDGLDEHV